VLRSDILIVMTTIAPMKTIIARPFVKWVGGKGKLAPQLIELINRPFNNYYEPFLGGGAFYFRYQIMVNPI
jgi:DNA adenine methylase